MRRMRIFMWIGLVRRDIVEEYAPWASAAMEGEAQFEAIGCIVKGDPATETTSLCIPEEAEDVNHWVACIKAPASYGNGGPEVSASSTDETLTFAATYLSMSRIVIETVADGDCGLDTKCLMLGLQREREVRRALRWEMGAFLLRHIGNRALLSSMFSLGEVSKHNGLFELEAAGAVLLADKERHGDGSNGSSQGQGESQLAPRSLTSEEHSAVRWKCRLHKASPEAILNVLHALPEWSIELAVQEYLNRSSPVKPPKREVVILSRDSLVKKKNEAVKQFLDFLKSRERGLQPEDLEKLKEGKW